MSFEAKPYATFNFAKSSRGKSANPLPNPLLINALGTSTLFFVLRNSFGVKGSGGLLFFKNVVNSRS